MMGELRKLLENRRSGVRASFAWRGHVSAVATASQQPVRPGERLSTCPSGWRMMITQDGEGLTLMRRTLRLLIAAALCGATAVLAQSDAGGWGSRALPYNGQFTFVRLRWRTGRYAAPVRSVGPNFWLHEYPRAEQNLISVIDDVTLINTRTN